MSWSQAATTRSSDSDSCLAVHLARRATDRTCRQRRGNSAASIFSASLAASSLSITPPTVPAQPHHVDNCYFRNFRHSRPIPVRTFHTSLKARGARRAPLARDPARGRRPGGRSDGRRARRAGASARGTLTSLAGRFRLCTCGTRRAAAVRYPGHCLSPADRRHARQPRPRGNGHPLGAPSLEPTKITVKSAPACGLRVPAGWRSAPLRTVIFFGT